VCLLGIALLGGFGWTASDQGLLGGFGWIASDQGLLGGFGWTASDQGLSSTGLVEADVLVAARACCITQQGRMLLGFPSLCAAGQ
jgi:hypothetical protein